MAKMGLLFFLMVVIGTGAASLSPNQAVDVILDRLSKLVVEKGKSEIQLEDLKKNFTTKVVLLNVPLITTDGVFIATEGNVSQISSYKRTGDARLKRDGKTSILSADFSLQEFALVYENYNMYSYGVYQRGQINARAANNTFTLQVEVKHYGHIIYKTCATTLTGMSAAIGDYQMVITDLRIFQNVEKDISVWVKYEMHRYIQEILKVYLKEAVESANLCENLKLD